MPYDLLPISLALTSRVPYKYLMNNDFRIPFLMPRTAEALRNVPASSLNAAERAIIAAAARDAAQSASVAAQCDADGFMTVTMRGGL